MRLEAVWAQLGTLGLRVLGSLGGAGWPAGWPGVWWSQCVVAMGREPGLQGLINGTSHPPPCSLRFLSKACLLKEGAPGLLHPLCQPPKTTLSPRCVELPQMPSKCDTGNSPTPPRHTHTQVWAGSPSSVSPLEANILTIPYLPKKGQHPDWLSLPRRHSCIHLKGTVLFIKKEKDDALG